MFWMIVWFIKTKIIFSFEQNFVFQCELYLQHCFQAAYSIYCHYGNFVVLSKLFCFIFAQPDFKKWINCHSTSRKQHKMPNIVLILIRLVTRNKNCKSESYIHEIFDSFDFTLRRWDACSSVVLHRLTVIDQSFRFILTQ